MKRKLNINKKIDVIKQFILNNRMFLLFIFISLLNGLLLRILTIGTPLYFKAFVSDLLLSIIVGSFSFLLKPKNRYTYCLIWLLFSAFVTTANTIYFEFYQSYISINYISTASMIGQVNDSLWAKLRLGHFVYFIFPIIYVLGHKYLVKHNYFDNIKRYNGKKLFGRAWIVCGILLLSLILTLTKGEASKFLKLWNRESVVQKYGIYVYTVNDVVQSIHPKINTLFGYDDAAYKFRNYYACKWEDKKEKNEYTDIFKGKNVLFIHAESIQNFLIDLKINGNEVTPNINKFAHEGLYFTKFYPQISVGTSSDTEFTLTTGLMPSSSGTVFVNYYDRTYYGMPNYFNNLGYYTFSMHGNNAEYWNRKAMHETLGYNYFYAKDSFEIPEDPESPDLVGIGLSDKSFFRQAVPILSNIKDTRSPFFGTIITLSNHSPFSDVEKYGDFDVTMNYTFVDENGKTIEANAPYLEGSSIGNYMKSSHYADAAFGELIESLKENNLLDNTIIVFYGDHEARHSRAQFNLLYNYDPYSNSTLSPDDENYYDVYKYNYDLLKNTPLIIWSNDEKFNKEINKVMGMYDVLPTIANMFGFSEKWSLGNDVFSSKEGIVVFPNGNVLTDKVYYSDLNDEYIAFSEDPIEIDYINKLKEYADNLLDVSNGIIVHDLIKREGNKIGECIHE